MEEEAIDPAVAAPARPVSRRRLYLWLSVLAVLAAGALWAAHWWSDWSRVGPLEPSGGRYFARRTELPVPLFRQGDPQWRADLLGPTPGTIGAEGCALSSAAMVLSYYGVDTDPHRLNEFLIGNGGYTPEGWIYWEKAAELAPDRVRKAYEDPGSYRLIDQNLLRGNPVIVKLKLASGTTHFVVIAGKTGFDYLTRDPGGGSAKGLYPLKELGSRILGLRFYEKLK
jgi:hypothetical protein